MGIFISVNKTIECVVVAVLYTAFFAAACYRTLGALQACGYGGGKLMAWSRRRGNQTFHRHLLLALLCLFSSAVLSLCFSFVGGTWAAIIGCAGYVIFYSVFIWADNRVALRVPVAHTARFKRLYAVAVLLSAVIIYFAVTLLNFADFVWGAEVFSCMRYCALAVFPVCIIPFAALANLVDKIYEIPHNRSFVRKAKKKLAASGIKVVGITGSYGKTSAKRILNDLLSRKYRVLCTPSSYNTPMGIALCLNNNDLDNYDIFIAEMGARHLGDIAELCEFCPPDYSAITGICPQHLESFGSEENIVKAKGEILNYTKVSAVIADNCFDRFSDYSCKRERVAETSEIICTPEGTQFKLHFNGETKTVKTRLLGRHSADNIALAARLALELGMTADEIAAAVPDVQFIEHRLQLTVSNGVNIIDDGYNSSVAGAAAALEVLKTFEGGKIVVTPGLVELGILEESENYALGEKLAETDMVILVGETLVQPVRKGYLAAGGDPEKLVMKSTLSQAQEALTVILKKGDTVLFLNDLPDVY